MGRLFRRLWLFVRRDQFHRELEEEMAFHREQSEKELRSEGMAAEAARHTAMRGFGNDLRLREQSHETVAFWFEGMLQDFRFALRQLRRNRGFAVTAIAVLALGIAASVTIFAFVDAALLQPLPYENPSRLVHVTGSANHCEDCGLSYPDYLDWKKANHVFSSFAAWEPTSYLWKSTAGVQSLRVGRVSGSFFRTLGVTPLLGRGFTDADDRPAAPRTVVLPYSTWQRWFSGREDILGQSIFLDDQAYIVIGVLARDFHFAPRAAELWVPIHDPETCDKDRSCRDYAGIARLKDDVSLSAAAADMKTIAAALEREHPESNKGQTALVMPLRDAIVGDVRPILLVLLSGVGLLLLIAYVNVASLLLVRAENRRREMALRGALGASTGRLVRQFVTEGLVLATLSTAMGVAVACAAIRFLFSLIPERTMRGLPFLQAVGLHPRVLLFALVVSLLGMVVLTVAPALRLSVGNLCGELAKGGRGSAGGTWKHLGSNLVIVELAIAVMLLASAGLLGKSLYRLLHVDLNFHPDHVATLEMDANTREGQQVALSRQVISQVETIPGVTSAALSFAHLPVSCNCGSAALRVQGHPWNGEDLQTLVRAISTDYFKTLQVRLVSGRFFTEADDASKPSVAIINRTLAKRFFPNEDPIGRVIGDRNLSPDSLQQIVGVVDDIREAGLSEQIWPAVYSPLDQAPSSYLFLAARTKQEPGSMLPALVAAIHEAAPEVGVRNEFTMAEHIGDTETAYLHRSAAWLVGGFAAMALLLGSVGLYGVIAYSVSQRTREIGVRMALGARRGSVYRLILSEAGWLTVIGLGAGLAVSLAVTRLMQKLLFGVQVWDVPTLIAVAVVLGMCALLASYWPARCAASVNPVEALRSE